MYIMYILIPYVIMPGLAVLAPAAWIYFWFLSKKHGLYFALRRFLAIPVTFTMTELMLCLDMFAGTRLVESDASMIVWVVSFLFMLLQCFFLLFIGLPDPSEKESPDALPHHDEDNS